jgi:hypothetical protein
MKAPKYKFKLIRLTRGVDSNNLYSETISSHTTLNAAQKSRDKQENSNDLRIQCYVNGAGWRNESQYIQFD